jgi:hypothetical protein
VWFQDNQLVVDDPIQGTAQLLEVLVPLQVFEQPVQLPPIQSVQHNLVIFVVGSSI